MLTVTLFGRSVCHLCDQAKADLQLLEEKYPHKLVVIDIDGNADLSAAYGLDIPVIEVGPYKLRAPFDRQKLTMVLGAAQDRQNQLDSIDGERYKKRITADHKIAKADLFAHWFSRHYMLVFNLLIFIYVGLPFLAPVLQQAGAVAPAGVIYKIYGGLCHQLSYRSFFLFGEQPIYPRETAGLDGYQTFQDATGLDEQGLLPARQFVGNDVVGYKIALCQRDIAIYIAMLSFGIVFAVTGRKWKPLPFAVWIALGIFPIAYDGGSQMLGQLLAVLDGKVWDVLALAFPYRESVPFLRLFTGTLFGLTTAWLGFPLVEETMTDTRRLLVKKFAYIEQHNR
ncbi:MAG: glutaredoxin family protein [Chloroflexota bacterium]